MTARERLIDELRTHALVLGEVVLTSGATAQYYVDAKRAILRPAGFRALGELVAERAREWDATAVGGMTMGADPVACAALAGGADVKAFFVRKERDRKSTRLNSSHANISYAVFCLKKKKKKKELNSETVVW